MIYPRVLEELIEYFKKLPGIGEKNAERLALSIIDSDLDEIESFSRAMVDAKKKLHPCVECGNLAMEDRCNICQNDYRNHNLICVVEDYKTIFAFEKMGKFNGVYHVLNGLISPINGITPYDINIDGLIKRCQNSGNIELIIALKPSIEGETTTQYINKILEKSNVNISRLSYGIPVGADLDYLDSLTLERAFEERKKLHNNE